MTDLEIRPYLAADFEAVAVIWAGSGGHWRGQLESDPSPAGLGHRAGRPASGHSEPVTLVMPLTAPVDGVVKTVNCRVGQTVAGNVRLVELAVDTTG